MSAYSLKDAIKTIELCGMEWMDCWISLNMKFTVFNSVNQTCIAADKSTAE